MKRPVFKPKKISKEVLDDIVNGKLVFCCDGSEQYYMTRNQALYLIKHQIEDMSEKYNYVNIYGVMRLLGQLESEKTFGTLLLSPEGNDHTNILYPIKVSQKVHRHIEEERK